MNFYKSAALALDHLEKNQGSVKGSLAAAGVKATPGEAKRILACERGSQSLLQFFNDCTGMPADSVSTVVIETLKCEC
jgi:putative methyltransferase